jgi:hypothetical protein
MKRTINLERLKSTLQHNTGEKYYSTSGIADGSFFIYLTNGDKYLVREGYYINWSDEIEVKIQERSINAKKNMEKRANESEGFIDGVGKFFGGLIENISDAVLSDSVDIEWAEIREVQSI